MKLLAVTLQTQKIRESDLLVTALSEERGRFTCMARGAFRSKQRFPGGIDLWDSGYFELEEPKKRGALQLEGIADRERWPALREDLGRFALAAYCTEIVLRLTEEDHEEDGALCRPLLKTLQCLNSRNRVQEQISIVLYYSILALRQLGYDICENSEELSGRPELGPWLREMLETAAPIIPVDPRLLGTAIQTISSYIESILGREMKTKSSACEMVFRALKASQET